MNLKNLSDQVLLKNTEQLVKRERELLTDILWHLREIDRRRLFCDLGCSSLYQYAVKYLGYSEDQAYRRINAARLLEAIPEVEAKINTGELNLSHLSMAQSFFRAEENSKLKFSKEQKLEVLEQIESKSARDAQKVILALSTAPQEIKHPEKQRVVTSELSELNFLADEVLLEKIKQLKGLLAHSHPNMSLAELVNYLCDMGLEKLAQPSSKKKISSSTPKSLAKPIETVSAAKRPATFKVEVAKCPQSSGVPCAVGPPPPSKVKRTVTQKRKRAYILIKTRRELWQKAQGRCENCGSKHALETDHRIPISKNGDSSLENIRLLCRKCNQREAIKILGSQEMDLFIRPKL